MRYTVQVEGLGAIGNADALLRDFRQQSTLEAERKDPANAAQIGRRASADADLLTQLLRAQGYYDADVEPRTEKEVWALRQNVLDSGGLFILGTERHESRRIDNQLRGRSGR